MTAVPGGGGAGAVGEPGLLEDAVTRLLVGAPESWVQLHAEFEPSGQPVIARVVLHTADGASVPVSPPAEVLALIAEHQRRSAAAGARWRHLVIDAYADGRLSAFTDATEPSAAVAGPRRWPVRVLAAITVACLAGAGAVFALAWRWSPPPRADIIAVPAPPPRQVEAFAVIQQWSAARNADDIPALWALTCANPSEAITEEIGALAEGQREAIDYPGAVTDFQDNGTSVAVSYDLRLYPLSEVKKREVAEQQLQGGYFWDQYTLVEEGGALKICDSDNPPE